MDKSFLLESLKTRHDQYIDKTACFTKSLLEQTMPDIATAYDSSLHEKIPGLFSKKDIKVGSINPVIKREGESIESNFTKSSTKAYKNPKDKLVKDSNGKVSTTLGMEDFSILPGFGYPAMQYDQELLSSIKPVNLKNPENFNKDKDAWTAEDVTNLLKIVKRKSNLNDWIATKLNPMYVLEKDIESGRDAIDGKVRLLDVNAADESESIKLFGSISYGFYNRVYTIDDSKNIKTITKYEQPWILVKPHNQGSSEVELVMGYEHLDSKHYVVAFQVEHDHTVLLKIPTQHFDLLKMNK